MLFQCREIAWKISRIAKFGPIVALSAALGSAACGAQTRPVGEGADGPGDGAELQPTIYGGAPDLDDDSYASIVALRIGNGAVFDLCTGTLIAPNLVLTARHCVGHRATSLVVCQGGQSTNGDNVGADVPFRSISVYSGASPSFNASPRAVAKAIVHDHGGDLCDDDIAFVVLDRALDDVPIARVRVDRGPSVGETVRSIGYGGNDVSLPVGTRISRSGIPVLAVGPTVSARSTDLGPREFELGLSTCQGDSGGPAISETSGAVIGVVSRAVRCEDDFGHIYTSTAGYPELFAEAFRAAGATPLLERETFAPAPPPSFEVRMVSARDSASGCSVSSERTPRDFGFIGFAFGLCFVGPRVWRGRRTATLSDRRADARTRSSGTGWPCRACIARAGRRGDRRAR